MMAATRRLSIEQERWLAIEAQGLDGPRPTVQVDRRHLRALIDRIGTVQLDAINVLERTQFLVLFSRLGPYDVRRLHEMTGARGDLFEYWGHAASLLPMATHPLFRWRMEHHRTSTSGGQWEAARRAWRASRVDYVAAVLDEVRARGPLAASALDDPRRRQGEWWDRRSDGRLALEWLFTTGELAAWRSPNFERVYDLAERVIRREILSQPAPPAAEAQRVLIAAAARALGVGKVGDLADYYRV